MLVCSVRTIRGGEIAAYSVVDPAAGSGSASGESRGTLGGSAEVRKDKEEIPVKRQKEGKRKVIEDKDSENNIMEINEKNNEIK